MDSLLGDFADFHKECSERAAPRLVNGKFGKVSVWKHGPTQKSFFYKQIDNKHFNAIEPFVHHLMKCNKYFLRLFYSMHSLREHLLVMDYISDGDLFDLMQTERRLREPEISLIAYQLIDALQALHKHNVVHNDIKLENVLYRRFEQIYICDYGLCKIAGAQSTYEGTVDYFSPEKINKHPAGAHFDWWAVGVLLYEISTGNHPYKSNPDETLDVQTLEKRQIQRDVTFPADYDNAFLQEFICSLLGFCFARRAHSYAVIQKNTYWKSIVHWKQR
ncbi:protein kinase-1 [Olene mendosa nucleopolyhedrovirus]|uniref:Protein kinase-1 n=1 Tax=Olene mendosa nucleopolyhedrovirus TaxID=2933796 RepID=A0AAX3ATN9_9ABAC|nr:protein kinase-1 [Olene mendosa nucleopolyhedrovirus]UOQ18786.1 protein kinase-1 [Olene mendosa nucleopolyhedrovirus]